VVAAAAELRRPGGVGRLAQRADVESARGEGAQEGEEAAGGGRRPDHCRRRLVGRRGVAGQSGAAKRTGLFGSTGKRDAVAPATLRTRPIYGVALDVLAERDGQPVPILVQRASTT
jgi:hypothetical protein